MEVQGHARLVARRTSNWNVESVSSDFRIALQLMTTVSHLLLAFDDLIVLTMVRYSLPVVNSLALYDICVLFKQPSFCSDIGQKIVRSWSSEIATLLTMKL